MFKKMIAVALSALIVTSVMPLGTFAAEMSDSSEAVAAVEAVSLPPEKELVGAEEQTEAAAPEVTEEVTSQPAEKKPTEPITEKQTEAPVEPTTAKAPAQPAKEKDAEPVGAAIESEEAVGKSSFTYSVSNNQVTITGLSDEYLTDLVIPDTIEDLPVTTIAANAFSGCDKVTSITVPKSVTSIGVGAFKGTNPTKVTLPFVGSSRTATKESAVFGNIFGYEIKGSSNSISGATYQYYYYYYSNNNFYHYYIPKTIKEVVITDAANIPNYAFYNCDWIESIQVNEGIKTIGESAFYNCAKLTRFEIPDTVEAINSYAFSSCTSLETVDIPASLTQISSYTFRGCTSLETVNLPATLTQIGSYAFSGCTSLETVDLPASLTKINEYAFNNCSALNIPDLVIPDGVTSIGDYAFNGCDKVTSITIPKSVTSIGNGAFRGTNPTKVTLPFIGSGRTPAQPYESVFGYIFGMESKREYSYNSHNVPGAIIQYSAFSGGSQYDYYYYHIPKTIKEVIITDAEKVPTHAFHDCDWIESIQVNEEIKIIGESAFYNCAKLTRFEIPDTVEAINSYAFSSCTSLETVDIPASLTQISSYTFRGCTSLETVNLPATLTQIGSYAFSGCTSLETVDLPASLTKINEYAFNNCSALNIPDLVIPDGVTSIGDFAFNGCDKVTSITVPKSVTSIGVGAFKGTNPTKVTLPFIGSSRTAAQPYESVFGYIFGMESKREYSYNSHNVPGAIIQYSAFSGGSQYDYYYCHIPQTIKEVVITDAEKVPTNAFYNCDWIEEVTINDIEGDASMVGSNAFYNCKAMTVYINRDTAVHTYCERNGIRHCSTKSLTLEKDSLVLFRNETYTIGSEVILLNGKVDDDPETVWTSSDPEVASVDRYTGVISAVAPGTVTITADSEGVTQTVDVTVYFKLESIALNKQKTQIDINESEILEAIFDPNNTSDSRAITWTSSDESVATVDENGKVTAHKRGTATITATAFNGMHDECTVKVLVPMTDIAFEQDSLTIARSQKQKLNVIITPEDTTDTYTLTCSDNSVAIIDRYGNLTARKVGDVIVTAETSRGLKAQCLVTVNSPATSVQISDTALDLFSGKSAELNATLAPGDVTDGVKWTTSDPKVAAVTNDGKVTAKEAGKAVITVTADSGVSDSCEVNVVSDINDTDITLEYETVTYDMTPKMPGVTVYYHDTKLIQDVDYRVEYDNNTDVGEAYVLIFSISDGTFAEKPFTISPVDVGNCEIVCTSAMEYTGKPLECLESITFNEIELIKNVDYSISYSSNTDAGAGKYTISGKGNFKGTASGTFTITPKSIALFSAVVNTSTYIYDGTAKTPGVTVKDGSKTLEEGKDYTLSYAKNINVGTAEVTVNGQGNYTGTITRTFTIETKSIDDFAVTAERTLYAYDGKEKRPAVTVTNGDEVLTKEVDYKVEYKNNTGWGTATLTVTGNGDYTGTRILDFTIYLVADVDLSGNVEISDVTALQRHLAEFLNPDGSVIVDEKDEEMFKIADVDGNGNLNIEDATVIQRYLADFPVNDGVGIPRTKVKSITLSETSLNLLKGQSQTLSAVVLPSDAYFKTPQWTSSDTSVASVDQNGKVTAVGEGIATIYAKAKDNADIQAFCTVTVKGIKVSSVTLSSSSLELIKGQSQTLTASVAPSNADNKELEWSSTDAAVAKVDQNGKVTAVSAGTAKIYAKATDGSDKQSYCEVTVENVKVSSITLSTSSLSMTKAQSQTLTASVEPSNADNKKLQWSSSNTAVATVDQNGKVIAAGTGTATIYAKATDGSGVQGSCTVNVKGIKITSIILSSTSLDLTKGQSQTLTATIAPSNADNQTLQWSSSNTAVAKVDQNGKVTAVGEGSATIYAKATDGSDKQGSCKVNVEAVKVSSVTVSPSSLTLTKGQTKTLTATVSPSGADNKSLQWSSSDTAVAKVDQNGKVTAVGEGSATIYAKATDGSDVQGSCKVNVEAVKVSSITLSATSLSLTSGETKTLTATVSPSNADNQTLQWSSSDTSVVTVNQSGKVTAVGEGSATIYAKATDGSGAWDSCLVTVNDLPDVSLFGNENNIELKVWVPYANVALAKKQVEDFKKLYPEINFKKIEVSEMSEFEAASQVLDSPNSSADVFGIPSDYLNQLYSANALAAVPSGLAGRVKNENVENTVRVASVNNKIYAYPETCDNSYYLVYDKSVVSNDKAKTLEGILEACKNKRKKFIMDCETGYYSCIFAFTSGVIVDGLEPDGVTQCFKDYDEDEAVETLMAFAKLIQKYKGTFTSIDVAQIASGFDTGTVGAGIDGIWNANADKQVLGNNFGAAELPTINVNGKDKQMIPMCGYKYLGVNAKSRFPRAAQMLAYYLGSEDCQIDRARELGWGPSNLKAQEDEAVKNDPVLCAIVAQSDYAVAQVGISSTFWWPMGNLGNELYNDSKYAQNKSAVKTLIRDTIYAIREKN